VRSFPPELQLARPSFLTAHLTATSYCYILLLLTSQAGDSVNKLAARFGLPCKAIIAFNLSLFQSEARRKSGTGGKYVTTVLYEGTPVCLPQIWPAKKGETLEQVSIVSIV
jgi:hypothetical protein